MFSSLAALALTFGAPLAAAWDVQHVLSAEDFHTEASATGDNWAVREQYDSACVTGSRQFAGQINVTDDKSMFFCKLIECMRNIYSTERSALIASNRVHREP